MFAVSDTGVGIAAEDHERVFEEFSQVDGQLQRNSHGTGLGLPLSRRLAELLGGELWLDSTPGQGSTFYLAIPVTLNVSTQAVETDAVKAHGTARKKILVVDDDETFRYVLLKILNDQGRYEVAEAVDGRAGLERLRTERFDLLVLDLQMPHVDGFAVLQTLRSDPATNALPVLITTSLHVDPELVSRLPEGTPLLPKQALSRDRVSAMLQQLIGA
jgi:CheY-like chemotaxis protein